jgi:hypothetical protein
MLAFEMSPPEIVIPDFGHLTPDKNALKGLT